MASLFTWPSVLNRSCLSRSMVMCNFIEFVINMMVRMIVVYTRYLIVGVFTYFFETMIEFK